MTDFGEHGHHSQSLYGFEIHSTSKNGPPLVKGKNGWVVVSFDGFQQCGLDSRKWPLNDSISLKVINLTFGPSNEDHSKGLSCSSYRPTWSKWILCFFVHRCPAFLLMCHLWNTKYKPKCSVVNSIASNHLPGLWGVQKTHLCVINSEWRWWTTSAWSPLHFIRSWIIMSLLPSLVGLSFITNNT